MPKKETSLTKQGFNFVTGSFSNRKTVRAPTQFNFDDFSSKLDLFIFTSITPFHLTGQMKQVEFCQQ